jgi:hypothetical protein
MFFLALFCAFCAHYCVKCIAAGLVHSEHYLVCPPCSHRYHQLESGNPILRGLCAKQGGRHLRGHQAGAHADAFLGGRVLARPRRPLHLCCNLRRHHRFVMRARERRCESQQEREGEGEGEDSVQFWGVPVLKDTRERARGSKWCRACLCRDAGVDER